MKTTLIKFISLSILLGAVLALATTASFAGPKKSKSDTKAPEQSLHIVGVVDQVNKDRTFELISLDGQRYHVHMAKEAQVDAFGASVSGRRIYSFDDLYQGARVAFTATHEENTYMVNGK